MIRRTYLVAIEAETEDGAEFPTDFLRDSMREFMEPAEEVFTVEL